MGQQSQHHLNLSERTQVEGVVLLGSSPNSTVALQHLFMGSKTGGRNLQKEPKCDRSSSTPHNHHFDPDIIVPRIHQQLQWYIRLRNHIGNY